MLVAESNQKPDIDMRFLTAMARQSSMNNRSSLKIATQNWIKTSNCRSNTRSQKNYTMPWCATRESFYWVLVMPQKILLLNQNKATRCSKQINLFESLWIYSNVSWGKRMELPTKWMNGIWQIYSLPWRMHRRKRQKRAWGTRCTGRRSSTCRSGPAQSRLCRSVGRCLKAACLQKSH